MSREELLVKLDEQEVIEVCQRLVRTNSVNPPGNERQIGEYVAGYLQEAGLQVELIEHDLQRASVLARLKGSGELPGVLYSAHLDTVPIGVERWQHDPFGAELVDNKLWGRGSSDMKGGLAAMMVAAATLARSRILLRGDLVLALTAGEEVDSLGATAIVQRSDLLPLQALVVSEPSSNDVFVAEKGALWIEITTHGKTAHGSMPDLGHNAVMMMVALINALEKMEIPFTHHPLLGGFSCSLNTISGGIKTNVIPDFCSLTIDMRTVPGQHHARILKQYQDLIDTLQDTLPNFRASLRVVNDRPPITTPVDHPVVSRFNQVVAQILGKPSELMGVRYFTDAAAYIPFWPEVPVIICGPGIAGLAHQPNEYVELDKLVEGAKIQFLAALEFLA